MRSNGEDVDVYVEHQLPLGVPFDLAIAHAEEIDGIRVVALEHLLVLKLDAAQDRIGSGKGEKDVRDIARIVALLDSPRKTVLSNYMTEQRSKTLSQIMSRADLPAILGLNAHDRSRFRITLNEHAEAIQGLAKAGRLPQQNPHRALRVLEILAYGFQDYFARESVCGRGYFVYPVTPEHGRAWLSEIGRRGGSARSAAKAEASRRNGRS